MAMARTGETRSTAFGPVAARATTGARVPSGAHAPATDCDTVIRSPLVERGGQRGRTRGCDSSVRSSIEEVTVIQQGQVFKLKAKGADGEPLWAYRYRLEGPASARPQVGGVATRAEAQKALQTKLARLGPGGRR